jgi:[Skp1-protein]-hydroxyproline N-acetylglucosaminyltransferase
MLPSFHHGERRITINMTDSVRKNAQVSSVQMLPSVLRSWTPATTRLLSEGGASAWNVLDHAMEANANAVSSVSVSPEDFVANLNEELEREGLLQQLKLKPARTNGEIATGISASSQNTQRGDCSLFIDRSRRARDDFVEVHPVLSTLIRSVEETVLHHLGDSLDLDLSLTSVQIAEYPGDGVAGYIRHCDRGAICHAKPTRKRTSHPERIITVIYYLTPDDWSHDRDGGVLRLFLDKDHYDVIPYRNRMVVFRSDSVEHEVLPSSRRPRRAVTIWLYGKLKGQVGNRRVEENVLPKLDAIMTGSALPAGPTPLCISQGDASQHQDQHQASIFISIAAYRDSETGPTIRNLMETARYPGRVFVGLVLQVAPDDSYDQEEVVGTLPTAEPWYDAHVRCLTLDGRHATGPCPARALCQLLHRGEDYVLQIDSHMRFRPNWDVYLIGQLLQCPGSKNVLTAYPVGYQLPNVIPNETRGTLLIPNKFGPEGMLRQTGRFFRTTPDRPVRCQLYAAGFNFCSRSVIQDCPYDHTLHHLFFGEESSMAVRLYTAGYDMYAPTESVCYHLWSRAHRPAGYFVFNNNNERKKALQEQSLAVVLEQLTDSGQGRGLGKDRTAAEWATEVGLNFEERTVGFRAPEECVQVLVGGDDLAPSDDGSEAQTSILSLEGTNAKSLVLEFLRGTNANP